MSNPPPSDELSAAFGFIVPDSLRRLLEVAQIQNPTCPDLAFRGLDMVGLFSQTEGNPEYNRLEFGYHNSYNFKAPEFFAFAHNYVCFGMHTGFYVDSPAECTGGELPVATFCFENYGLAFEGGATMAELLIARLHFFLEGNATDAEAAEDMAGLETLIPLLNKYFDLSLSFAEEGTQWEKCERLFGEVDDRLNATAGNHRSITYPTHDKVGVVVPESTIDRSFLDGLWWPALEPWGMEGLELGRTGFRYDPERCQIAEARLRAGEPGTALVIAKNLRALHFREKRKPWFRQMVEETQQVMAEAYVALNRHLLAERLLEQDAQLIELLERWQQMEAERLARIEREGSPN